MKYGVQITTTKNGKWSVSQLVQRKENGQFIRIQRKVIFIDYSEPIAAKKLLDAIGCGLKGKIRKS